MLSDSFSQFKDIWSAAKNSTSAVKGILGGKKQDGAGKVGDAAGTTEGQSQSPPGPPKTPKRLAISNNAVYQDFKLYIEGEECPFESATVAFGVSALPVMTLQLAPYHILRNLGERTKVHLYFIDPVDGNERLLFDGEIGGVGYTKNPSVQTLTYSVNHVSSYLDEVLVSFFDLSAYAVTFPPLYAKNLGAELDTDYGVYNTTTIEKVLTPSGLKGLDTFQAIFVKLFEEIFKIKPGDIALNPTLNYFKKRVDSWKLDKRMATMPAAAGNVDAVFTLKDFIGSENLLMLFIGQTKKVDGFRSIFTVLAEMFREILYYPVILPSPYLYNGEQLQQILYKPQALFVLPPVCNVIWPSMYTVFSYSRNYKNVPTRLFVRAGLGRIIPAGNADSNITESVAQYFWAPKALRVAADALKTADANMAAEISVINKYQYGTDMKNVVELEKKYKKHEYLLEATTAQEDEVGVRPAQPANNEFFTRYAEWLLCGNTNDYPYLKGLDNGEVAADKVAQLADYELARQQHETCVASMVMVFNPYLVPGFPALVMDKPESGMHVYGYVTGVTHTISAAGGCSTMADIGYIRQYDDTLNKRFVVSEDTRRFIVAEDAWADEDAVYERLLGVKSIKGAGFNTIEDEKIRGDAVEIARNIAGNLERDDFHDYVYNAYVRSGRNIVTKPEYDKFVDIEKGMSEDDLARRRDVQAKVRQYRLWVNRRVAGSAALKVSAGTETVEETVGGSVP